MPILIVCAVSPSVVSDDAGADEYYEALNKIVHINSNQEIELVIKEIVKAVEDKCSL